MPSRGFTLIELLVVIAIIGILSSIVMASLNTARESARISKAESELRSMRSAIILLEHDTGKWPNGCPPGTLAATDEKDIDGANVGLTAPPTVDPNTDSEDPLCSWSAANVAAWKGPYLAGAITTDPWGHKYGWDPDYWTNGTVRRDCPLSSTPNGIADADAVPVIFSKGRDGIGGVTGANGYGCDDVVYMLNAGTFDMQN